MQKIRIYTNKISLPPSLSFPLPCPHSPPPPPLLSPTLPLSSSPSPSLSPSHSYFPSTSPTLPQSLPISIPPLFSPSLSLSPPLFSILSLHPSCHTRNPVVVFQPCFARCSTSEHFLFTNTYLRGLRITTYSYFVCVSQPRIINISFIPMNTHTHSLTLAIIHEEHNCTV